MTALTRKKKKDYSAEQMKNTQVNSKETWKILNKITGYKNENAKMQEKPSMIVEQGQKYEIEQEIAEAFNQYHVNMAKNLRNEFEDLYRYTRMNRATMVTSLEIWLKIKRIITTQEYL